MWYPYSDHLVSCACGEYVPGRITHGRPVNKQEADEVWPQVLQVVGETLNKQFHLVK